MNTEMLTGAYYILYNLLGDYLYGVGAVLTGDQTLTLTMVSTLGALFVIALPFMVVYWVFRKVCR